MKLLGKSKDDKLLINAIDDVDVLYYRADYQPTEGKVTYRGLKTLLDYIKRVRKNQVQSSR